MLAKNKGVYLYQNLYSWVQLIRNIELRSIVVWSSFLRIASYNFNLRSKLQVLKEFTSPYVLVMRLDVITTQNCISWETLQLNFEQILTSVNIEFFYTSWGKTHVTLNAGYEVTKESDFSIFRIPWRIILHWPWDLARVLWTCGSTSWALAIYNLNIVSVYFIDGIGYPTHINNSLDARHQGHLQQQAPKGSSWCIFLHILYRQRRTGKVVWGFVPSSQFYFNRVVRPSQAHHVSVVLFCP